MRSSSSSGMRVIDATILADSSPCAYRSIERTGGMIRAPSIGPRRRRTPVTLRRRMATDGDRVRVLVADDHPIYLDGICSAVTAASDLELVGRCEDGATAL